MFREFKRNMIVFTNAVLRHSFVWNDQQANQWKTDQFIICKKDWMAIIAEQIGIFVWCLLFRKYRI